MLKQPHYRLSNFRKSEIYDPFKVTFKLYILPLYVLYVCSMETSASWATGTYCNNMEHKDVL